MEIEDLFDKGELDLQGPHMNKQRQEKQCVATTVFTAWQKPTQKTFVSVGNITLGHWPFVQV